LAPPFADTLDGAAALPSREPSSMGIQYAPARARRWLDEYAYVVDVIAGDFNLDELVEQPQLVLQDNVAHDVAPSARAASGSRSMAGSAAGSVDLDIWSAPRN